MSKKISVICTAFNAGPHMKDTLKGVISQTYKDWELLVMDGGSKDGTVEMVKEYSARDPRVKLHSEPDEGALHAYEKGLAIAAGDFLVFTCGQDFFSDSQWFSDAIKVLNTDKQVSLVWALGRGITEDGKDVGTNASYAHFVERRGKFKTAAILVGKSLDIAKDLIFADRDRRKFLLRKIFSKSAPLRVQSITATGLMEGNPPQKEDWFFYWLKTGLMFPDQCIMVSKKAYVECASRYKLGSRRVNSFGDFIFNFNTHGYLAYCIPKYVGYGLLHASSSGNRAARELYIEAEKYLDMVQAFREKHVGKTIVFKDRTGNKVSERKIE